jgi:hypothetical protein
MLMDVARAHAQRRHVAARQIVSGLLTMEGQGRAAAGRQSRGRERSARHGHTNTRPSQVVSRGLP